MSEWLKEHAWKACVGETLPRVRIPLSPPIPLRGIGVASGLGQTAAHPSARCESERIPPWSSRLQRRAPRVASSTRSQYHRIPLSPIDSSSAESGLRDGDIVIGFARD